MSVSDHIHDNKGKSLLVGGIFLMIGVLLILFKTYGYEATWQLWGIPTEMPAFKDFRMLPGAAESFRNGLEPSVENPGDPNGRLFNYPAIWRLLFYTNISQDDTVWIVLIMLLLFVLSVTLFSDKISRSSAIWMLVIVFSPACMLLYERGNADLIVFSVCTAIVLSAGRSTRLATALTLFGTMIKMFPLFGIGAMLREGRRRFYLVLAASSAFIVTYGALTFRSQSAAWSTTQRGGEWSYGTFVVWTHFQGITQSGVSLLSKGQWKIVLVSVALLLILIPILVALYRSDNLMVESDRNLAAFRLGAGIYIGTFLLGNNWDYRLAFLIFVVPQLSEWMSSTANNRYVLARLVMASIVISCWHLVLSVDFRFIPLEQQADRTFVFDELMNWALLMGLAYLLIASSPQWFRADLQRVFGMSRRRDTLGAEASPPSARTEVLHRNAPGEEA